jgi:hypothetical protein
MARSSLPGSLKIDCFLALFDMNQVKDLEPNQRSSLEQTGKLHGGRLYAAPEAMEARGAHEAKLT